MSCNHASIRVNGNIFLFLIFIYILFVIIFAYDLRKDEYKKS